jgi:hypothetical protein
MKISPAALHALKNNDLDNVVVATTEGGIEKQEAKGQEEFISMQTLPQNCPKENLERLGFVFGADEDDIFVNVQFPEGWEKKPTEHSMWTDLLDEKGRKRGSIFYKASFYDRSAKLHFNNRFSFSQDYEVKDGVQYRVKDGSDIIFTTDKIECEEYSDTYWAADDNLKDICLAYLKEHYPIWEDETKYWD